MGLLTRMSMTAKRFLGLSKDSDQDKVGIFDAGWGALNGFGMDSSSREWMQEFHRNGAMRTPFNRTAEDVAMVDWHLYRVKGSEKVEVLSHPLLDLMATPAPGMTGFEWRLLKTLYLDIGGNSFCLVEFGPGGPPPGSGLPVALYPIPPHWIRRLPCSSHLFYHFDVPGAGMWQVPADFILWQKRPNLCNPWGLGKGVALSVDDELQQLTWMNKFNSQFFKNGAHPGMIIGVDNLTKDNEKLIRSQFERKYNGVMNAFKTAFIGGAIKVFRGMAGHKDMDFNAGIAAKRDAVRQAAGPPAELCGDTKGSNRAQIQGASNIQQRYQVTPRCKFDREFYASFLLPFYSQFERDQAGKDSRLLYLYDDPVEEAAELRLAIASEGLTRGALSINEWRHSQGWDTKAGLDVWQVPTNVTSVSLGAYPQTLDQQQAIANGEPVKAVFAESRSILDKWRIPE